MFEYFGENVPPIRGKVCHCFQVRSAVTINTFFCCFRNMSTKMSPVYKKNHSIVSGFKTTSRVTLHCLTSRDPHRSGYAM